MQLDTGSVPPADRLQVAQRLGRLEPAEAVGAARHVEVARYRVPASVLTRTGPTLGVVVWDRARALERTGDA